MFVLPLPPLRYNLAHLAAAILHANTWALAFAQSDAAIEQLMGRAYTTILALEDGLLSRRVFSTVPSVYPVGEAKALAPSLWRTHVVENGRVFVAGSPADIRANFPDPDIVAGLGATCLVNVPIAGPGRVTIGLLNVAAAKPYDDEQLGTLALIGQVIGPALLQAISCHDGRL